MTLNARKRISCRRADSSSVSCKNHQHVVDEGPILGTNFDTSQELKKNFSALCLTHSLYDLRHILHKKRLEVRLDKTISVSSRIAHER